MEQIKERNMKTFVLSYFLNFGIGFAFGLVVGIAVAIISGSGAAAVLAMPFGCGFLASIFAVNMYRVYFYYTLSLDVDRMCRGDGLENESYLTAMVLSFATFGLYRIYWISKIAKRLRANAPRYGFKMLETDKEIAVLNFRIFCFGFISVYDLIKNVNRMAEAFNAQGSLGEYAQGGNQ